MGPWCSACLYYRPLGDIKELPLCESCHDEQFPEEFHEDDDDEDEDRSQSKRMRIEADKSYDTDNDVHHPKLHNDTVLYERLDFQYIDFRVYNSQLEKHKT
jgi:hypothetical protein